MMGDSEQRLSRIALAHLVEPGHRELGALVRQHGASAALDLLLTPGPASALPTEAAVARLEASPGECTVKAAHAMAEAAMAAAQRLGARVITAHDDEWPDQVEQLASTPNDRDGLGRHGYPPLCLWVRGATWLDEALAQSVAMVGARASTHYGDHVATTLAYELADRQWTIVAGGAYGIDAAAHRGALNAGGFTVAVLACGIDRPYPSGNSGLFDRIAETGLLVSQWPPGTAPARHRYLDHGRVVAAATRGTVLVEASARSRARATLHHARLLHRPAMVVPGPVTSTMSIGSHAELRDHPQTRLVRDTTDIIAELTAVPNNSV